MYGALATTPEVETEERGCGTVNVAGRCERVRLTLAWPCQNA